MKFKSLMAASAVILVALCNSASAITLTASDLIGKVVDGTPTGDAIETSRLNGFINFYNLGTPIPAEAGQVFTTYNVAQWQALDLPAAVFDHKLQGDNFGLPVTISESYAYAMAKYGNGQDSYSLYFYLGGQTGSLTQIYNLGGGLSHVTLFTPTTNRVPDGGSTAILLGLALVSAGVIARRRIA